MSQIMIDCKSRVPIHEQIIKSVKELVVKGYMKPEEPLPSVRILAGELAINPNTIQKAYTELERQGITYSIPGKGCFVSSDVGAIEKTYRNETLKTVGDALHIAMKAGIDRNQITELIDTIWEKRND